MKDEKFTFIENLEVFEIFLNFHQFKCHKSSDFSEALPVEDS
jgi:hypothetical protein